MSLISHLSLRKDEDFPAIKKKKSRNPKPRDKWSLLWFIPSNVLNLREEGSDGKGQMVKKGKRLGFDTYNQLGCKVCRKAFHKYQSLAFHSLDEDHGRLNPSNSRSSSHAWSKVGNRTYQASSTIKKSSVEALRKHSVEPSRKSSRVSIKPVTYDDEIEIEILEVEETSYKPTQSKNNYVKEIDEAKFGKLTLSAKRKIVEDYNIREKYVSENKMVAASTKFTKIQAIKNFKPKQNTNKSLDEIEIIDIDLDEEPKATKINMNIKSSAKITKIEDEELLLAEEDVITNEEDGKKRKSVSKLLTPNQKKIKTLNEKTKSEDMVEVKSSSGKSMFVHKATLEKIMASKAMQKSAAAKKTSNDDEKLLSERGVFEEVTKNVQKKKMLEDYSVFSPKKTRSRGI